MQALLRVIPIAKELLTIRVGEGQIDLWLWERSRRVLRLSQLVARLPEAAGRSIDLAALGTAALFHSAAWVSQVEQGRATRWQVLSRPTSDIQRELSAALMQEHIGPLLPAKTVRLAAEAIRHGNDRGTALVEAQLLSEAENLDDIGAMFVLRQFRQYQADGRPLRQMVASWGRQQEYHYWEARINDGLRFETTRMLTRARLEAVDTFMRALARDLDGTDLAQALEDAGIELPSWPPDLL